MEAAQPVPESIEVYVRSLSPQNVPQQQELFDQLNSLSMQGVIDHWTVHVVGEEVCPDTAAGTHPGRFICGRIRQFKAWADRNDMSFGSFFERRPVSSELSGDEYETIHLPSVTLAEFDEQGTLRFVAPSFDEETHHTPASRIERLLDRLRPNSEFAVSQD